MASDTGGLSSGLCVSMFVGTHRRISRWTMATEHGVGRRGLPLLLTVDEAAELLRTTRRAIYAMVERRQLPGVVRLRRRVLFRSDVLLDWLDQKRAPLPKE